MSCGDVKSGQKSSRVRLNANMWYVTVASVIVAVLMALFVFAH